jgi:flagellar P-ring protein FlgI
VHESVARIPDGAMIERDLGQDFASRKMFRLTLQNPDFTTAARVVTIINGELSGKYASAQDAGTIDIISPPNFEGKGVELLATIERLEINPDQAARVVVNEKTGTVVIGHQVKVSQVALSHGDLSLKVSSDGGKKSEGERLVLLKESASVGDLVDAMNKLGVSPKDLIAILQSIKSAGALHGELEIL